ncbi:MAG: transglutaminase [Myxococcales bacterium]|nr:hypothetical protein [Myxococcales bacterium]MCB9748458.1 transglutaminase [Myxococcales bacterium]
MPRQKASPSRLITGVVFVFKLLWSAAVVLVPALGVWFASSLAAYRNGPVWLVCLCGALLFPVLPLAWDALAGWRRRRKGARGPRVLTFWDRLVLRTLTINLVFLSALLARFPAEGFAALSTRGDWFLDGQQGARVDEARVLLFRAADGLEWLYVATHENPYESLLGEPEPAGDDDALRPGPTRRPGERPLPQTTKTPEPDAEPGETGEESSGESPGEESPGEESPAEEPAAGEPDGDALPPWPLPETLHPLVANMPADVETSIESVARYIADNEPVQWRRVKALHDYVADRVAYDAAAYVAGRYPPQDAETVFRSHVAVCAGYARLLAALGEAAGEEIVVVSGDARNDGADVTGEGHAWNAAKLGDFWYLVDATWDAGHVNGDRFTKEYETGYLFTPPAVFGVTHFPDEERWQLRDDPVSRGDFFRQPMMHARFYAEGLELLSPTRSQVSVSGALEILVKNPRRRHFLVHAVPKGGGEQRDCEVDAGPSARFECAFPSAGTYTVRMFASPKRVGTYAMVGELEVNAAGS